MNYYDALKVTRYSLLCIFKQKNSTFQFSRLVNLYFLLWVSWPLDSTSVGTEEPNRINQLHSLSLLSDSKSTTASFIDNHIFLPLLLLLFFWFLFFFKLNLLLFKIRQKVKQHEVYSPTLWLNTFANKVAKINNTTARTESESENQPEPSRTSTKSS